MRNVGCALIVSGVAALLAGCGSQTAPSNHGGVAVVDLDAVAKRIGRADKMNDAVQKRQNAINEELTQAQKTLQEQFDKKKEAVGENPTEEQQQELNTLQQQIVIRLNQARQEGQRQLTVHQANVIQEFRDELKPLLREIAVEQGLSIVIPKDDRLLLTFEPAVDITSKVVEKLQGPSVAQQAAAPKSSSAN